MEILNTAVRTELDGLPVDIRAKMARILDLMVAVSPQQMREPHVKPLGNKLWEMRMTGRDGIARAIYMLAHERRIIILHAFIKKTRKTPAAAIQLATKRAEEVAMNVPAD